MTTKMMERRTRVLLTTILKTLLNLDPGTGPHPAYKFLLKWLKYPGKIIELLVVIKVGTIPYKAGDIFVHEPKYDHISMVLWKECGN